jgi:hypothetical protein
VPSKITDLLLELREKKELELYYYLFNNIEVINFEIGNIEISSMGSDNLLNQKLVVLLFKWTDIKWNVNISNIAHPLSLKDRIKSAFVDSNAWKYISDHFHESEIADILLKK